MGYRSGQLNVAHPLSTDLGLDDLNAALFAHHTPVFHSLVLAAVAFIILGRTKDLGTEKPVTFRFKGSIVDRFRLLDLPIRPFPDLFSRCQRDAYSRVAQGVLRFGKETV